MSPISLSMSAYLFSTQISPHLASFFFSSNIRMTSWWSRKESTDWTSRLGKHPSWQHHCWSFCRLPFPSQTSYFFSDLTSCIAIVHETVEIGGGKKGIKRIGSGSIREKSQCFFFERQYQEQKIGLLTDVLSWSPAFVIDACHALELSAFHNPQRRCRMNWLPPNQFPTTVLDLWRDYHLISQHVHEIEWSRMSPISDVTMTNHCFL